MVLGTAYATLNWQRGAKWPWSFDSGTFAELMFIVYETIRVFFAVISLVLVALLTNPIQDSLSTDPTGSGAQKQAGQIEKINNTNKLANNDSTDLKLNKNASKIDRKIKKSKSRS